MIHFVKAKGIFLFKKELPPLKLKRDNKMYNAYMTKIRYKASPLAGRT